MMWLSKDCPVIVFKSVFIIVGPYQFGVHKKSNAFFFPEIDGVRVITKKRNEIIRRVPHEYRDVETSNFIFNLLI